MRPLLRDMLIGAIGLCTGIGATALPGYFVVDDLRGHLRKGNEECYRVVQDKKSLRVDNLKMTSRLQVLSKTRVVGTEEGRTHNLGFPDIKEEQTLYTPRYLVEKLTYSLPIDRDSDSFFRKVKSEKDGWVKIPADADGHDILAVQEGIVTDAEPVKGYKDWNRVIIDHGDGVQSTYNCDTPHVKKGDIVKRGQKIGYTHHHAYFLMERTVDGKMRSIDALTELRENGEKTLVEKLQ